MLLRAAAIKVGNQIYTGGSHAEIMLHFHLPEEEWQNADFGYVDDSGRFIGNWEAAAMGIESSDDLDLIDDFPRIAENAHV